MKQRAALRFAWFALVLAMLLVALPAHAAQPAPQPARPVIMASACDAGAAVSANDIGLPGGAFGRVCVPSAGWNGDLIVYAHGYVVPGSEPQFANLTLPGASVDLPTLIQRFGYAFATTTYRRNGLAVLEGVQDLRELIAKFSPVAGRAPAHTYILGVSEGGLIATLFAERYPLAINGALAACGPIGDFQQQIEYFGDFRVLFDSYFPGVLPGTADVIPDQLITNWASQYVPAVTAALATHPISATNLISDSGAAVDSTNEQTRAASTVSTTLDLLWYNVFSTNDARTQLGGNPYGNAALLARFPGRNLPLFTADITATQALGAYQTSGKITVPLVTIHTTGDDVIPFRQQQLYGDKVQAASLRVFPRTVERYGHCTFGASDLQFAFFDLIQRGATLRRVFVPLVGA